MPLTIQSFKDLNKVVETENNLLRKRIADLEKRLAELEAENKRLKEILPGEGWKVR